MKLLKMLYGLTLMLGCFVLASCVNDEEGPCLPDGKTQVLFSLVLQDNTKGITRAGEETWNNYNPKDTGVEYDNYIELDKVQMLLFKNDGTYAGKLGDLTYTKSGVNTYQYVGIAPSDLATGGYKFVILANCANITPSSFSDLGSLAFITENTNYIPMWGTKGITTETTLTVQAGTRQSIGTISLLRAMSKVTVKLEAKEGATGNPLRGYSLKKVAISNFNQGGYVVPTGYDTALETKELKLDACIHVNPLPATNKEYTPKATGDTELTFYLPEYDNIGTEDNPATPAVLTVTLTKDVEVEEDGETQTKTLTFEAPIQFCDYFKSGDNQGKPDTTKPYNIIRNHWYQFNIYSVSDDGALYVNPTVADWKDATPLDYTIKMSTSMRLFDSWLYRYDTDNDYTDWTKWATSHMVVSSGRVTEATTLEPIDGRPKRSPQIQLVTTGVGTFELYVDNSDFEIVQAVKGTNGEVASYATSTNGTLNIPAGDDVYTYFYIVPKANVTPSNPEAKVFLYYNDPVLGKLEVTYNYNSLPGYSDDSAEIWAYYVSDTDYDAGKLGSNTFMRMYYQDSNNPLVPVQ